MFSDRFAVGPPCRRTDQTGGILCRRRARFVIQLFRYS